MKNYYTKFLLTLIALSFVRLGLSQDTYQQGSDAQGIVCVEAENYTSKTDNDQNWTLVTDTDASGGEAMIASPAGSSNGDGSTTSGIINISIKFEHTGIHHFWFRHKANGSSEDSHYLGVDGAASIRENTTGSGSYEWLETSMLSVDIATTGTHVINIYTREAGLTYDKILLTLDDSYNPQDVNGGLGPDQSPEASATTSVTGVSLDQTAITLALDGTTTSQLSETVAPADATDKSVTWSSLDETVATVSTTGLVTAVAEGTTTITVTTTDGSKTASCAVTVNATTVNVTGVTVDPILITLGEGTTSQLTETVAPADATDKSVTWSSLDETVATVSTTGLVTAVAEGTTTITVTTTDGSKTASCAVTVNPLPVSETDIHLNFENNLDDDSGNSRSVTATNEQYSTESIIGSASFDFALAGEAGLYLSNNDYLTTEFSSKSIAFFMKEDPQSFSLGQIIYEEGGGNGMAIYLQSGQLKVIINNGSSPSSLSVDYPNNGKFHHVAFTYGNSIIKLYLDGILVGEETTSFAAVPAHSDPGGIGGQFGGLNTSSLGSGDWYSGLMDDFRIYNNTITLEEINALLPEGFDPSGDPIDPPPSEAVLDAHFDFENNLSDGSINNRNLTIWGDGSEQYSADAVVGSGAFDFLAGGAVGLYLAHQGYLLTEFSSKSITFLIKPNSGSLNSPQIIFEEGGGKGITIYLQDGMLKAIIDDATGTPSSLEETYPTDNQYHHVAFTFGNSTIKLYLDGVKVGETTTVFSSVTAHSDPGGMGGQIGGANTANLGINDWYTGLMDDFRIYTGVLTQAEIEALVPDIVPPVNVTGVSLNKNTLNLFVGESEVLAAGIMPDTASNNSVTWASSNPGIATVSENGLVTAVSEGITSVIATTNDGGFKDTCEVTVNILIPVTAVSLNFTNLDLPVGQYDTLIATIVPNNATDKNVTWSSSNTNVATVDENGVITIIASGIAIIRATTDDGNYSDECIINSTINSVLTTQDNLTLRIYPNPVGKELTINISDYQLSMAKILITDVTGKTLYSQNVSGSIVKINTENLKNGVYFIALKNGDESIVNKFIISR